MVNRWTLLLLTMLVLIVMPAASLTSKEMSKMKIRELKAVLKKREVKCKDCSTKAEYVKKVLDTNHKEMGASASADEENWIMDYAIKGGKLMLAGSPLILLASVFLCGFEDEDKELGKRKKKD